MKEAGVAINMAVLWTFEMGGFFRGRFSSSWFQWMVRLSPEELLSQEVFVAGSLFQMRSEHYELIWTRRLGFIIPRRMGYIFFPVFVSCLGSID
jgi:hypothetical protein